MIETTNGAAPGESAAPPADDLAAQPVEHQRIGLDVYLNVLGVDSHEHVSVCHKEVGGPFRAVVVAAADAPAEAARWAATSCVWFGINPVTLPVGSTARGKTAEVARLVALVADLDIDEAKLTADTAVAVGDELSRMLGVDPVVTTFTGHGFQPVWAVERDESTDLTDPERRTRAKVLVARFGRLVKRVAAQHGGSVDTVFDLPRVSRVPRTTNYKYANKPVPVFGIPRGGSPISLDRLSEVLDEYDVPQYAEDGEQLRKVVNDPHDWSYAEHPCTYARTMVDGWSTDTPAARHPWLVAQGTRLAAAHRYGCLTEAEHERGARVLTDRMHHLCTNQTPHRKVEPGEIEDALAWGVARVATMPDGDRLRSELGHHEHSDNLDGILTDESQEAVTAPERAVATLAADLWDARPVLRHLHDFARARMVAPLAVLGVAMARIAAATPAGYVLPPLVGGPGSMNLLVALVGPSGAGKGAAHAAAEDALNLSGFRDAISSETVLHTPDVGSGEGVVHQYAKWAKTEDNGVKQEGVKQIRETVLFTVPEIDQLTAVGSRQGATLLPILRKAYSGEALSFAYADPTKRLHLRARSYRMALTAGVQPGRAAALLDDADGGTPQRFVWLPVTDPDMPRDRPAEPDRWTVALPGRPLSGQTKVTVCAEAEEEITDAHWRRSRGRVTPWMGTPSTPG